MNNIHTLKGWKLFAKYYGYPNCCTEAFLKGNQNRQNIFVGTGFLPCNTCARKDPMEILKIIDTNRICPEKFSPLVVDHLKNSDDFQESIDFSDKVWSASEKVVL